MPRVSKSPTSREPSVDEEMEDAEVEGDVPDGEEEVEEDDDNDDDDDDDDDDEEDVYVIETIMEHEFRDKGKRLYFLIRWEGYPEEKDYTWEPEDNCDGAPEAIAAYFESIGGRPSPPAPAKGPRGRKSLSSSTPVPSAKKEKAPAASSARAKKSKAYLLDSDEDEDAKIPRKKDKDDWKPPSDSVSWEDEIRCIDNLEKGVGEDLLCYVHWNNGRKTQHPAHVVYKQAPQKMLQFYEKHLVFRKETESSD